MPKKKTRAEIKQIADGWENVYTGLGGALDKITGHEPSEETWYTEETLEAIFQSDAIAQRIITELPDTAFRNGWSPVNQGDLVPEQALEQQKQIMHLLDGDDASNGLNATQSLVDAIYWGRLYGRGGLLIGANDGQAMDAPLDPDAVSELLYLEALDSRDFWPLHYYDDPSMAKYGQPAIWALQRQSASGTMEYSEVHESRILVFGSGVPTSRTKLSSENWRWQPLLQALYERLRDTPRARWHSRT